MHPAPSTTGTLREELGAAAAVAGAVGRDKMAPAPLALAGHQPCVWG